MKQKLLLIVPTLHQGGQERVVVRSARLLADKYDITIAIFDDSDIGYDTEGLDIVNLNVPSARFKLFKLINIIRRTVKLKALKKKINPDISYSQGGTAGIINCLTSSYGGAIWVGIRSFYDVNYVHINKIYKRYADLIVCCAKDIEYEMQARYNVTKTATLYNPYDCDRLLEDSKKGEPDLPLPTTDAAGKKIRYIMALGRNDDLKCYWHMIKTFKLIQLVIPEARLVIIGGGDFDPYKRMIKGLGLEDDVIFTGAQSNPFVYLKHGEILWLTSRIEGFPNALVEGMAVGLVPVAVNCPSGPAEILIENGSIYSCAEKFDMMDDSSGPKVIYGEYGVLTPSLSYDKDMDFAHITAEHFNLAEAIVDLMHDDAKMASYSKKAMERARMFGYEEYHDNFDKLVEKINE
ncbi:MAG: glycosyltransferase [Lachnospiraceae bacterium]|nr:glycosyltransferase [Lachnospiraceae bacterium]